MRTKRSLKTIIGYGGIFVMLCLLALSFGLSSISKNTNSEMPPSLQNIQSELINVDLQIIAQKGQRIPDTHTMGLEVVSNAGYDIYFPDGYNMKAYIKEDGNWIEIPFVCSQNDGGEILKFISQPAENNPYPNYVTIFFVPDVAAIENSDYLYVTITGYMYEDEPTDQIVAAYVRFPVSYLFP